MWGRGSCAAPMRMKTAAIDTSAGKIELSLLGLGVERRRFTVESLLITNTLGPPGRCGSAQWCAGGVADDCEIRFKVSLADGRILEAELCAGFS